ncbi:MAG: ATP-binding cassette domain-containing protein [Deltaproteobacteria bacterium]|jgi:energy-coupling factor transport system ATP-binding protein|nr:ATP-binding cassette domain-containing protein [Deltaproteobacteria bacterium]
MEREDTLKVKDLSFKFNQNEAWLINNLSFKLKENERVLLMGPSGCGKSTLAYLLSGLYPEYAGISKGSISYRSLEIANLKAERRAAIVSIVFQNPDDQFSMESVEGELFFALENAAYGGEYQAKAAELLALVGLKGFEKRKTEDLSGGEKQKLSLATALAVKPKLLILDEPLANLDRESAQEIVAILKRLSKKRLGLLIIDHRPDFWLEFIDSLMLVDNNFRVVNLKLSPNEAKKNLDIFKRLQIFFPSGSGFSYYGEDTQVKDKRPWAAQSELMVRAENLTLQRGAKLILEGASFKAFKGTLTAVLGPSGCGKSSLLMALAGIIKIKGWLDIKGGVGLIFQNPGFQFLSQTVRSEIILSLTHKRGDSQSLELIEKARNLAASFTLADFLDRSPWQLSQGQQRRLAVLSMLAAQKEFLLLDEPTYAQDLQSTVGIMSLLNDELKKGLTAIMVTHDLELARAYADEIVIFNNKRLKVIDTDRYRSF